MRRLIRVKRDIVHTIRQAVVSKYAGGALPERARTRVKGFILTLPQRWGAGIGTSKHPLLIDILTVDAEDSFMCFMFINFHCHDWPPGLQDLSGRMKRMPSGRIAVSKY